MSIPTDFRWRGAAACLSEPVTDHDDSPNHAEALVQIMDIVNRFPDPEGYIVYRSSYGELDILCHVFLFDDAPYESIFRDGFRARLQGGTHEEQYCNLELYVNTSGKPLDSQRDTTYIFVSTTLSSSWYPSVLGNNGGDGKTVYRYEIYAPGGIWVAQTLGDRYRYRGQDEVTFIERIDPRYIRSAQRFVLTSDGRYTKRTRADTILYINRNFNPDPQSPGSRLKIKNPVRHYLDNRQRINLQIHEHPERTEAEHPEHRRRRSPCTNDALIEHPEHPQRRRHHRKRSLLATDAECSERPQRGKRHPQSADDALIEYYTNGVTNMDNYIDSALRSRQENEVYIFIKQEYVLINYAPGSTDAKIIDGPEFIGNGFPFLVGTAFAEYGIDAAFGCHEDDQGGHDHMHEAIIFSGNLCARINYASMTTINDCIVEGPKTMTIRQMFPFFEGSGFEHGIDAAFESIEYGKAYLFNGSECALIDYNEPALVVDIRSITDEFPCLRDTEFDRDIGAAFASHRDNEAYLFKDNSYLHLYFTLGFIGGYIVDGPKEIVPTNWPSLKEFLPRKNYGLDDYLQFQQEKTYCNEDHRIFEL